jgi:hypothetical protein
MVRHHVHAHLHGFDHAPELDGGASRQFRVAAVLENIKDASCGSRSDSARVNASPGRSCSGSASAVEITWPVQNPATRSSPRNTMFLNLFCLENRRKIKIHRVFAPSTEAR